MEQKQTSSQTKLKMYQMMSTLDQVRFIPHNQHLEHKGKIDQLMRMKGL
jgi:hypothetical protein